MPDDTINPTATTSKENRMTTQTLENETIIDRAYLTEILHWVKTLNSVGVSPDKAAEIAKDFMLHSCDASADETDEEYYEDEEA